MKRTAVEWFAEQMITNGKLTPELFEQAKEMEKEQLKQLMWDLTEIDMTKQNKGLVIDYQFEEYWNENFKSE